MSTLAEIRQKLLASESKKNFSRGPSPRYRFYDMPDNQSTTVRFLPDGNKDNVYFWVEKQTVRLTFPGIVGDGAAKETVVTVPCVEMFGDSCPITAEIRPWWNDPSLKDVASKYWKKTSYIMQGIVVNSQWQEPEAPESPVRIFDLNKSLFNTVKSSLIDPDFIHNPTDYVNGTDFTISKTKKGQWADYSTSKWARRESSLSDETVGKIQQYGLNDLISLLPKRPTAEEVAVIYEMFQASVDGELYDPSRWAKYFKPFGFEAASEPATFKPVATVHVAPKVTTPAEVTDDSIPFDTDVAVSTPVAAAKPAGKSAQEILAAIRNKQQ